MATINLPDGGIRTLEPHEQDYDQVPPQPIAPAEPEAEAEAPTDFTSGVTEDATNGEVQPIDPASNMSIDPSSTTPEVLATPAAVAHADELGVDLTQVQGTGHDGTILKSDVAGAAEDADKAKD